MESECAICGTPISSDISLSRGVGPECWAVYKKALTKELFKIDGLSLRYNWIIQVEIIKDAFVKTFETTKFRSDFKKSFYKSIKNSDRISRKQLDIMNNWLAWSEKVDNTKLSENIIEAKKKYLFEMREKYNVTITGKAMGIARNQIRSKRAIASN